LNAALTTWFLVFTRVGAMLAVLPMFSTQMIPVQLRIALGALVALLVTPMLPTVPVDGISIWLLVKLMFMEVSIGLLLGFVCRFVFYALEIAGGFIATEMGITLPSEFNQLVSGVTMAPGLILYWIAMMTMLSLDLHHWMIVGFQKSYALVPFGGAHLSEALLVDVVSRSGKVFVIALQIAAPVMAVSFLVTLVFAVLGRAVPQMNVFSESFPVRTLLGLISFGLTCTFMGQHIANYLRRLPEDMLNVARLAGGAS
jgi:flagellar biosynthetic protein FliR